MTRERIGNDNIPVIEAGNSYEALVDIETCLVDGEVAIVTYQKPDVVMRERDEALYEIRREHQTGTGVMHNGTPLLKRELLVGQLSVWGVVAAAVHQSQGNLLDAKGQRLIGMGEIATDITRGRMTAPELLVSETTKELYWEMPIGARIAAYVAMAPRRIMETRYHDGLPATAQDPVEVSVSEGSVYGISFGFLRPFVHRAERDPRELPHIQAALARLSDAA